MRNSCLLVIFVLFFCGCAAGQQTATASLKGSETQMDTMTWNDLSRSRAVPVAVYYPRTHKSTDHRKIVIVSHGYGANKGGDYMAYSYLTGYLASKGYFVISIQHELQTDSLMPVTGIPQIVRRTNWERGAQNILFVLNEAKKRYPALDYKHLILIGHSNGGDMSMLFSSKYPDLVNQVISLDNRRVALPRTSHPKVYSLRSSDQPADEGVLPTLNEQEQYGMKIIKLANTMHNDMDDDAAPEQQKEINDYILGFLNDR